MTEFTIYEGHIDELRKKVEKIQNKANRLGCRVSYREVGEEFKTIGENTYRFIKVEAEGVAKLNGWEFVGSIEHTDAGNIIRKALVDVEVPERYRTSDTYCEHCQTIRRRNDVYLVRNQNGEFKQVGKNCLCDFTNGMSAAVAAEMASLRSIFEKYEQVEAPDFWDNGFLSNRTYLDTKEVLAYAYETVKHFGYKKSGEENSTKSRVLLYFKLKRMGAHMPREYKRELEEEMERVGYNPEAEEVKAKVEDIIKWAKEQPATTDYMNNLIVAVSDDYCDYRRFGILCSLIPTYNRAKAREQEQKMEKREAGYVGEVGQRITVKVNGAKCVAAWDSEFGLVRLWKFTDAEGNIYMWRTGAYVDEATTELTGTIKAHDEYNGIKQNVMTRCKTK